ncbi:MAG: hypothetical protein OEV42_05440 [Deltaproteobacteria bacterium]|nr:hypothetical protein [Deltaproteobacteria bacterium]
MIDDSFLSIILYTFFIHISFGLIGGRYERYSKPWARCLYIPIVITIILRRVVGLGYWSVPYFIVVALAGQVLGRRICKETMNHTGNQ